MNDYRDSIEKAKDCWQWIEKLNKKQETYQKAVSILHHADYVKQFEEARRLFKSLGNYLDSNEKAAAIKVELKHLKASLRNTTIAIPKSDDDGIHAGVGVPVPPRPQNQGRNISIFAEIHTQNKKDSFFTLARKYAVYEGFRTSCVPFMCYWPKYSDMNEEQLNWYFYWRSLVRSGIFPNTELSYIFVYIYELINQIGVDSPMQGLEMLMRLWSNYGENYQALQKYLPEWIFDYTQIHNLEFPYEQIIWKAKHLTPHILNYILTLLYEQNKPLLLPAWIIEQISFYFISQNNFYKQMNSELLNNTIPKTICTVDEFMRNQDQLGILKYFCPEQTLQTTVVAYTGALYERTVSYTIVYKDFVNELKFCRFLHNLIRYAENDLRLYRHYHQMITNIMLPDSIKLCIDRFLEKELSFSLKEDTNNGKKSIALDLESIDRLRDESNQVRNALISSLQENNDAENDKEDKQEQTFENIHYETKNTEYDWQSFFEQIASKHGFEVLTALRNGRDYFEQYAKEHHVMPRALIDSINEIADDTIGDSVADDEGFLDEYVELIQKTIDSQNEAR